MASINRQLMTIQLVSYVHNLNDKERLRNTLEILNNSSADFILFPGHTIGFVNDIENLRKELKNKKVNALVELQSINSDKIGNCLYLIKNGEVNNLYTNQLFATSGDINGNYELGSRLINEFKTRRKLKLKGKNILILQCGELNILKNIQSNGNRVEFRLSDDKDQKKEFKDLLTKTDIFLNPMHTPMGNQGKMKKRREFLSAKNKVYVSVSNTKEEKSNLELNGLQYVYKNAKELTQVSTNLQETYIVKEFEI